MRILGISAYSEETGAAIAVDGRVVAETASGRRFPDDAIASCLASAGMARGDLDRVVFFERPWPKWRRAGTAIVTGWPFSKSFFLEAATAWSRGEMHVRERIAEALGLASEIVRFCPHDISHAAASFFPSPFEQAAILVVDGAGEEATTVISAGSRSSIDVLEEIRYPHSLILMQRAFAEFFGLRRGDMKAFEAMASAGEATYLDDVAKFLRLRRDGSFELGLEWFVYSGVDRLSLHPRVESILGPPRDPSQAADRHFADLAASVQEVLGDAMSSLADRARERTGLERLCVGGSMAANHGVCERLTRESRFREYYFAPNPGDAGAAAGAALWASL
jgi:carbamoyltransferase